ncbi:hypothetical protein JCM11491_004434 [Sporobolomyces phaffii]
MHAIKVTARPLDATSDTSWNGHGTAGEPVASVRGPTVDDVSTTTARTAAESHGVESTASSASSASERRCSYLVKSIKAEKRKIAKLRQEIIEVHSSLVKLFDESRTACAPRE